MAGQFRNLAITGLMTVGLGGCETVSTTFDNATSIWSKPLVYECPSYRIIKDPAHIVAFKPGPGRDLVDINFEATIRDAALECLTYVKKNTKVGHMEVRFSVDFIARRGPANKTRNATLHYFVHVTDKNKDMLYREPLKITVNFPGNRGAIQVSGETIPLELPLRSDVISKDYIIYTGFALNREQLEYNRAQQ